MGLISLHLGDFQESSPTPQFKSISSSVFSFMVQLSHPYTTPGKTIALTRWTFVSKEMSLFLIGKTRGESYGVCNFILFGLWWVNRAVTSKTGSKITADGDCSHEIKRRLLLGRKVMTNLDSILKYRDITLPTKVHLVKAMVSQQSCTDVRVGP